MSQVVQQGGGNQHLGIVPRDRGGEPRVVRKVLQVQKRHAVDAQRMLESRMVRRRVD